MPGLRQIAEQDLAFMLEDDVTGFGWAVQLTSPDGIQSPDPATADDFLKGYTDDIAQVIDLDTGQIVSGRVATVSLRISSVLAAFPGAGYPVAIADRNKKPWIVKFDDINGRAYTFKIAQSDPDRALGILTCTLEQYEC